MKGRRLYDTSQRACRRARTWWGGRRRLENTSQRAYPIKHRVRGGLGCVGCYICTDAEGGVARIRGWLVREGNEVVY